MRKMYISGESALQYYAKLDILIVTIHFHCLHIKSEPQVIENNNHKIVQMTIVFP